MSGIDIDKIVRLVLADMRVAADVKPEAAECRARIFSEPSVARMEEARVVSLADVSGRLEGIVKLVIGKRTILTPSARDELRRRNIVIETGMDNMAAITKTALPGTSRKSCWLGLHQPVVEPVVTVAALRKEFEIETASFAKIEEIVAELLKIATIRKAVVLTRETAKTLCLANRHAEIWGIGGEDASRIAEDAKSVGANMLAIDPRRCPPFRLIEIVRKYIEA